MLFFERFFVVFAVFDCFLMLLVVLCWFGLFSAAQPTFKSSALGLHASTILICFRASRSLLRQVGSDRRPVDDGKRFDALGVALALKFSL